MELYHWGIKGMRWGIRRWQNPDGTLTEAGKDHYAVKAEKEKRKRPILAKTNEEIKEETERMNLEKNYFSTREQRNEAAMSRGKKLARTIGETAATKITTAVIDRIAKSIGGDSGGKGKDNGGKGKGKGNNNDKDKYNDIVVDKYDPKKHYTVGELEAYRKGMELSSKINSDYGNYIIKSNKAKDEYKVEQDRIKQEKKDKRTDNFNKVKDVVSNVAKSNIGYR